ncbi:hypothetical protein HNP55_003046 [Paucibacter oligotrophus]|uniref:Uncharacterized protein n=1 Tax=Roseateles oligotrophus TaxID=1769250 RepID=A0A840LCY2_9BURK|nr:hypothetical protein [Roseateles oligotrophus]MBB4844502.1 hypothetical protein [Roseateles oligotrophus]
MHATLGVQDPAMETLLKPQKTEVARHVLLHERSRLTPALRALLITVDGRRDVQALSSLAQGLGLPPDAPQQLRAAGLITWRCERELAEAARRAQALVRAKFFAMDLAERFLLGKDEALRASVREVDSEASLQAWLDMAAGQIALTDAGVARAAQFLQLVRACMDGAAAGD